MVLTRPGVIVQYGTNSKCKVFQSKEFSGKSNERNRPKWCTAKTVSSFTEKSISQRRTVHPRRPIPDAVPSPLGAWLMILK